MYERFKVTDDNWSPPGVGDYVEFCLTSADKVYDDKTPWIPRFSGGAKWSCGMVIDSFRETLYGGMDLLTWEILSDDGVLYEVSSNEFIGRVIHFHPVRILRKANL